MKACTSCPLPELHPSSLLRELGNISCRLLALACSPCSRLLTRTPFSGGGEHTTQAGSPAKAPQPNRRTADGSLANSKAETKLFAPAADPVPPQLTCCHHQPRSAGQTLAMPRSDSGKADPARRQVLPRGEGVRSMHRLLCAALWGQAAFKSH